MPIRRLSSAQRSRIMSSIRSKDTSPELRVRSQMHRLGYRYRLHVSSMQGKPDIVMPRYRMVIFVNGCFWHQHQGCKYATIPRTNTNYWVQKFRRTLDRDVKTQAALRQEGWDVLVIWECQTEDETALLSLLNKILPARR